MATQFADEKKANRASSTHDASIIDEKADFQDANPDDRIIEGSEGVTEFEYRTLRHVADTLPYTSWLVVIVEFAERYV